MFDVSCHCEERIYEATLMVRDCFGLDALAMKTVGHVMLFMAIAKNNVFLAIRNEKSRRLTVTGVFFVIPAKAGIQNLDPGSSPG